MKKKFYLFVCLICAFSLVTMAQNEIVVEPGDDIITIVAGAEDGDVIIIQPGTYRANTIPDSIGNFNIVIDNKSLTIKGEAGAPKPVLYIRAIDVSGNVGSLEFENIEVSGLPLDEDMNEIANAESEDEVGSYFVNFTGDLETLGSLTIKNCVIRNLYRAVIRGDRAEHEVDEIIIDNCIIHDIRAGSNYGAFRFNDRINLVTFILKNSTLYNIYYSIIQNENTPADYPETVTIEHCTFYDIGGRGSNNRYLFDYKSATSMVFMMRHNILGKTNEDGVAADHVQGWRLNFNGTTSASMIANNIAPDFLVLANSETWQGSYDDIDWSQDQFNEDIDPGFADPENGDFTLPVGSELLMASLEGEIIGDPRWHPLATSISSSRVKNTLSVYPNPARDKVTLEMENPGNVAIYSLIGAKIREYKFTERSNQVDVSGLTPGVYFLKSDVAGSKAVKLIISK